MYIDIELKEMNPIMNNPVENQIEHETSTSSCIGIYIGSSLGQAVSFYPKLLTLPLAVFLYMYISILMLMGSTWAFRIRSLGLQGRDFRLQGLSEPRLQG